MKKPGDSGTANLTLKNVGDVNASSFKVFSPTCTAANATGESYNGTGNPCSVLQLYIQQWTDNTFTTPSACLYGGATGNTCNFTDTIAVRPSLRTSSWRTDMMPRPVCESS